MLHHLTTETIFSRNVPEENGNKHEARRIVVLELQWSVFDSHQNYAYRKILLKIPLHASEANTSVLNKYL